MGRGKKNIVSPEIGLLIIDYTVLDKPYLFEPIWKGSYKTMESLRESGLKLGCQTF
jgi:hypothetical protein